MVISQDSLNIEDKTKFAHKNIRFWLFFLFGVFLFLMVSFVFFNKHIKKFLNPKSSLLVENPKPALSIEVSGKTFNVSEEEYAKYLSGEEIPQEKINKGILSENIKGVADYFLKECPEDISNHMYFDFLGKIEDKKVLCLTLGIMTFDTSQFSNKDWGENSINGYIEDIDSEDHTITIISAISSIFTQEAEVGRNTGVKILCNEKQTAILSGFNHEPLHYNVDFFKYAENDDYLYLFCSDQGCGISQDACIVIKKWEPDQL